MISKGTVVGTVEEVTPIDQEDLVWKEVQLCSKEMFKSSCYVWVKVVLLKRG